MTIQDFGAIGELVAAIATVATLAYLAVQIRQNASTNRSSSAASDTQSRMMFTLALAQDSDLSRIYWAGLSSRASLGEHDLRRFDALLTAMIQNYEQSWRFHKAGATDQETWLAQLSSLTWVTHEPGFTEWWNVWKHVSPIGFIDVVEQASRAESPIPVQSTAA